jgi:2-amino-4-hydroxy-6-hydroxymethyldihydropteridine diphosphokinase
MTSLVEVFLGLGTNLSDREANLARAQQELQSHVTIIQASSIYETPPWGGVEQPAFLNQVVKATTDLTPLELLKALKHIEETMGRVPSVRFGPRLIDIDILLFDDVILDTPELTIPHPRMLERAFVLVPLNEIAPDLTVPLTNVPFAGFLKGLDCSQIKKWKESND